MNIENDNTKKTKQNKKKRNWKGNRTKHTEITTKKTMERKKIRKKALLEKKGQGSSAIKTGKKRRVSGGSSERPEKYRGSPLTRKYICKKVYTLDVYPVYRAST